MTESVTSGDKATNVVSINLHIPISPNSEAFLQGELSVPNSGLLGLIIFAHGSGSGLNSPRNQYVAKALNGVGFATLLVDLLTLEQQETDIRSQKIMCKIPGLLLNKFNIRLLSNRLVSITNWIIDNSPKVSGLPIGYFGSSTGAAAAFEASIVQDNVYAIVSRGGRPDLVRPESIQRATCSTLLIIGAKDSKAVIDLNKKVFKQLRNVKYKELVMIPNAGHLFEEDGAIEQVANISSKWYLDKLQ